MNAGTFIFIGLVLMITPGLAAFFDGVEDEADMIQWLLQKPLDVIILYSLMVGFGMRTVFAGIAFAVL